MQYSVKMEIVALLVTIILAMFHYDRQNHGNNRYRLFNLCLFISGLMILTDIVTAVIFNQNLPALMGVVMVLNMLFFLLLYASFSLMAGYGFYLLFEHNPDKHCLNRVIRIITAAYLFFTLLILTNPHTGWFFSIRNGEYIRGPLNKAGYAVLGVELVMLCVCYIRNRNLVSRSIHKTMHILPLLVLVLIALQFLYYNTMMVGTISSVASLIFFISFQSNRIGQDALTELPNRYAFFQELAIRRRRGKKIHLVVIYLEKFANVNEKYGTKKGDDLLYLAARYLDNVSEDYQAFRFGNTRFLLLGNDSGVKKEEAFARVVQQRFCEPWKAGDTEYVINASFAHMTADLSKDDDNEVQNRMEYTILKAREAMGNSLVCFDTRLKELYERRIYVHGEVKKALADESFILYYQPVYDCSENAFTTAEALLRLFDSTGKAIPPDEFIPLAEEGGLIDDISWLVLKKVCQFWADHPDFPLKSISINMAIQQLADRSFFRRVHSCQAQYGVTADKIRIEITERTIAENPMLVRSVMSSFVSEGLKFYLDDFGIGYSNLAGMISLPFETIKLDASLIRGIEKKETEYHTVRLLVEMMHNAGFLVVAEGIETVEQAQMAKEICIDRIQGYYYARPMDEKGLEALMQKPM